MADHLGLDLLGLWLRPPVVDFSLFLFIFRFELVAAIRVPNLGFLVLAGNRETARPSSWSPWGRLVFAVCVGIV